MPPRVVKVRAGRSDASIKRKTHREAERTWWLVCTCRGSDHASFDTRCLTVFGGRQAERPNAHSERSKEGNRSLTMGINRRSEGSARTVEASMRTPRKTRWRVHSSASTER